MSFKLLDIYSMVDARTGQIARVTRKPELATTDQDRGLLLQYVEAAGHEVARRFPQLTNRQRWVTTVGAGCYLVTSNLLAPVSCTFNGVALNLIDGHSARTNGENNPRGVPRNYGIVGNYLWLDPTPETSKELVLFYRPAGIIAETDGATNTDEEEEGDIMENIPVYWKKSLADYVIGQWLIENSEPDRALIFMQAWSMFTIDESQDRKGAKRTDRPARYF